MLVHLNLTLGFIKYYLPVPFYSLLPVPFYSLCPLLQSFTFYCFYSFTFSRPLLALLLLSFTLLSLFYCPFTNPCPLLPIGIGHHLACPFVWIGGKVKIILTFQCRKPIYYHEAGEGLGVNRTFFEPCGFDYYSFFTLKIAIHCLFVLRYMIKPKTITSLYSLHIIPYYKETTHDKSPCSI